VVKPIAFKGQNCVLAEDQPEYIPLPAHKDTLPFGLVTFCYKLTFWERIIVLFTGKMWHKVLTFNTPLQPQKPSVRCPLK